MMSKGRGWSKKALRQPGKPLTPADEDIAKIVSEINDINQDEVQQSVNRIHDMLYEAGEKGKLKKTLTVLMEHCVENRFFGVKIAALCCDAKIYNMKYPDGSYFRISYLNALQEIFTGTVEANSVDTTALMNTTCLVGNTYKQVLRNGRPLKILAKPVLQCLKLLLEMGNDYTIPVFYEQMELNHKELVNDEPADFRDLFMQLRKTLVNCTLKPYCRAMLLYYMDFQSKNFNDLPKESREFYHSAINSELQESINSPVTESPKSFSEPINKEKIASIKESIANMGMKERVVKVEQSEQTTQPPASQPIVNAVTTPTVPRAIRGSGASNYNKEPKNEKSPRSKGKTDDQFWSSNQLNMNKGWGHDDRFDKDYD